jgi:two-component system sensor histidine kinase ResE
MKTSRYTSIRWRLVLPVFVAVVATAVIAALGLTTGVTAGLQPAARAVAFMAGATVAAVAVIAVFVAVHAVTRRVRRLSVALEALASGQSTTRTGLKPRDEIGRAAVYLDRYAENVQERQDELRAQLRRRRHELSGVTAVLESMPDGVVVLDMDGRVIIMNAPARNLLGSAGQAPELQELTATVTDALGAALAPGIYALGNPQRIHLNEKLLSAQAAAVMTGDVTRIGTVIVLRDITEQVRQERQRETLVRRLENEVHRPLITLIQRQHRAGLFTDAAMQEFGRELTQHTSALQKVMGELADFSSLEPSVVEREQKPLPLETLVWAVANEWRQVARAHHLTMNVTIGQKGLFVLGDERRLRWALGHLVDNAIKFTPHGGSITLELLGEEEQAAHIRIRDTGVGINEEDMRSVFTRFYRGRPTRDDGSVIQTPGTGQGLYVARQVVESHGGVIRLRSRVGVGTAVYVSLPLTSSVGFVLEDLDGETVPMHAKHVDEDGL